MLLDVEILLVHPCLASAHTNSIYGLAIMLLFLLALTLGLLTNCADVQLYYLKTKRTSSGLAFRWETIPV